MLACAFLPAIAQAAECKTEPVAGGGVTAARDGRSFVLSDGREVRLAGIEAGTDGAALAALIRGQTVTLRVLTRDTDRYGRIIAFAEHDGASVQEALLRNGQARVATRTGGLGCAEPLRAAEREARDNKRGLWAQDGALLATDAPERIAARAGHFSVIEGPVLTVREAGSLIYVNFGRRWSRDFTLTILRRNQRLFSSAGIDLKSLAGKRVRVRGVVELRGGPVIEAEAPEQIEIIQ